MLTYGCELRNIFQDWNKLGLVCDSGFATSTRLLTTVWTVTVQRFYSFDPGTLANPEGQWHVPSLVDQESFKTGFFPQPPDAFLSTPSRTFYLWMTLMTASSCVCRFSSWSILDLRSSSICIRCVKRRDSLWFWNWSVFRSSWSWWRRENVVTAVDPVVMIYQPANTNPQRLKNALNIWELRKVEETGGEQSFSYGKNNRLRLARSRCQYQQSG